MFLLMATHAECKVCAQHVLLPLDTSILGDLAAGAGKRGCGCQARPVYAAGCVDSATGPACREDRDGPSAAVRLGDPSFQVNDPVSVILCDESDIVPSNALNFCQAQFPEKAGQSHLDQYINVPVPVNFTDPCAFGLESMAGNRESASRFSRKSSNPSRLIRELFNVFIPFP